MSKNENKEIKKSLKNENSKEKLDNNEKESEFLKGIKADSKMVNKVIDRNNFLKEIDGNEKALNMLSIERLKKLEKYYDEIIEKNNKEIEKLKKEEE